MINWTLTEGVEPEGVEPGEKFWEVNGAADDPEHPRQDPHDARHFPTRLAALQFLQGMKMKRGDTLHVTGADTGRVIVIGYVREGDAIEFDVGTRQIANPEDLLEWLDATLTPGDTVSYLPTR